MHIEKYSMVVGKSTTLLLLEVEEYVQWTNIVPSFEHFKDGPVCPRPDPAKERYGNIISKSILTFVQRKHVVYLKRYLSNHLNAHF